MAITPPDADTLAALEADAVKVVRWVDIYEYDTTTLWRERVPMTDGVVTVDMNRDERRNLDITIYDDNGDLGYGPNDSFWYDKVLKPYRGIEFANGDTWVTPLGQFIPDSITRLAFPDTIQAQCRDITKKLVLDKFSDTTTFASGTNIGTVISNIAAAAGITNQAFATTAKTLSEDTTFERMTPRWTAVKELAAGIGYELFFDADGTLVFRPLVDPLTAPVSYTFQDGATSNLADWTRSTSDIFMFNDVVVYGSAQSNALVWAKSENTEVSSPTSIAKVGRRSIGYPSQFVSDNATAQEIADKLLSVSALEQFDMSFTSVMLPWLEVGNAIEINTSDAAPGDPTRFLLTNLSIDMKLLGMTGNGKRVTLVG